MKRVSLITLALAGVLIMASSGIVLADWSGEETMSEQGPAPGSFEYQEAVETGSLPIDPGSWIALSGSDADSQVIEVGASRFRLDVDTP